MCVWKILIRPSQINLSLMGEVHSINGFLLYIIYVCYSLLLYMYIYI